MTPQQILEALPISRDQVGKIQGLTAALTEFETMLAGTSSPIRDAITSESEACFALVASILGITEAEAEAAVLGLLGITESQLLAGGSRTTIVITFSCVIRRELSSGH
jgi:hypothetical protein